MKGVLQPALSNPGSAQRLAVALRRDDSRFRLALGAALAVHATLLTGFYAAPERRLGSPGGIEDAVSIDLATEDDLKGTATVSDSGGQPMKPTFEPTPATPPAEMIPPILPQQQAAPTQPQPRQPTQQSPQPEGPSPDAAKKEAAQQAPVKSPLKAEDFDLPALLPSETKKAEEKKAAEQKKAAPPQKQAMLQPEQKTAPPQPKQSITAPKLDLSLPQSAFDRPTFTSGSGTAGVERPAGTTRSGENDDFAKGVIRALQRTMPQLSNTKGIVTVRITLDDRGNLVSTVVTRQSKVAGLDQSVVFSTKQASFPIPPRQHVAADLLFLITYIYR